MIPAVARDNKIPLRLPAGAAAEPQVSAIIIFFNAEAFITEAIASVFAQTISSWELLLVDDGSTDTSTRIARTFHENYPGKVRYLQHEGHQNRGMSASRNLGIRHARGKYIAFLDSDDVWFPNALEEQVTILESLPQAGMVYGPSEYWYSWTGKAQDIERDVVEKLGIESDMLFEPPQLLPRLLRGNAAGTSLVLVRREVIERIGGFEESFRGLYEDQVLFAKMCLATGVFVASTCWSRYRQHPDSCCAVAYQSGHYHPEKPHPARQTFLNWMAKYMVEQGVKDPESWEALHKALWPYRHPILHRLVHRAQQLMALTGTTLVPLARHTLPVPIYQRLQTVWRVFLR